MLDHLPEKNFSLGLLIAAAELSRKWQKIFRKGNQKCDSDNDKENCL